MGNLYEWQYPMLHGVTILQISVSFSSNPTLLPCDARAGAFARCSVRQMHTAHATLERKAALARTTRLVDEMQD